MLALVTNDFLGNALLGKHLLCSINNCATVAACGHLANIREFRIIVSNDEIVLSIEVEQISPEKLPWACRELVLKQWFLGLGALVFLARWAITNNIINVLIDG